MNSRYHKTTVVGILGALTAAALVTGNTLAQSSQPAPQAAKDIFYRMSGSSPTQASRLALNYKILLKHGDTVTQVPTDYAFKSGDCFRLVFHTNAEGYVYFLHKGSTGNGRFLFPDPRIDGGKNRVTAYEEHMVPASGWFSFDQNKGAETIHVIMTTRPLPEFLRLQGSEEINPSRWERVVDGFVMAYRRVMGQRATKDIVYVEAGQEVSQPEQTVIPQASSAIVAAPATESTGGNSNPPPTLSPAVDSDAATAGSSHVATTQPSRQSESHGEQPQSLAGNSNCSGTGPLPGEYPNSGAVANHTVQTFVAQAEIVAGEQNVLVHTITLNHN